jgi:nucleotide-binding universal stress UspA family protein
MSRAILVGIDGSDQSRSALDWAAAEAALRNAPLHLLHAFPWPLLSVPLDPHRTVAWTDAQRLMVDSERRAAELAPAIEVTSEIVMDGPATALIKRAEQADLVVVGTRGHGGFIGLIVGSAALQVAGHAPCSVVVVGPRSHPATDVREIVVGVDGRSADSPLQAAFEEAALRGVRLRALHAWRLPEASPGDMVPLFSDVEEIQWASERHLAEALAGWREKFPEVPVVTEAANDRARHAMIQASSQAELLVVGTRDHSGPLSLALGSVTHAVLHRSACPVLVARTR